MQLFICGYVWERRIKIGPTKSERRTQGIYLLLLGTAAMLDICAALTTLGRVSR
jgi:hypothetical protein